MMKSKGKEKEREGEKEEYIIRDQLGYVDVSRGVLIDGRLPNPEVTYLRH